MSTIEVLDPRPRGERRTLPSAARHPLRAGSRVGFIDNSKPNAEALLRAVSHRLTGHGLVEGEFLHKRDAVGGAGFPSPTGWFDALAADGYQLVVTASGDCGGCTSWSLQDCVELERRGVPSALVCTDVFEAVAVAEATAAGLSDFASTSLVVVEHPLAGLDEAALAARADDVVRQLATLRSLPAENRR